MRCQEIARSGASARAAPTPSRPQAGVPRRREDRRQRRRPSGCGRRRLAVGVVEQQDRRPGASAARERSTIVSTPGQRGVEDALRPAARRGSRGGARRGTTSGLRKPCGARNRRGGRRADAAQHGVVRSSCRVISPARGEGRGCRGRSRVVAISWPSRTIRSTISGCCSACLPRTKKVARASASRSASSTRGVVSGDGPSSKVIATTGSWTPVAVDDAPEQRRVRREAAHGEQHERDRERHVDQPREPGRSRARTRVRSERGRRPPRRGRASERRTASGPAAWSRGPPSAAPRMSSR